MDVPPDAYFAKLSRRLAVAGATLDALLAAGEAAQVYRETHSAEAVGHSLAESAVRVSFSGVGAGLMVGVCLPAEGGAAVPTAGTGAVVVGLACGAAGAYLGEKVADATIAVVDAVVAPTLAAALGFAIGGDDPEDPCDGFGESLAHLGSCLGRGIRGLGR